MYVCIDMYSLCITPMYNPSCITPMYVCLCITYAYICKVYVRRMPMYIVFKRYKVDDEKFWIRKFGTKKSVTKSFGDEKFWRRKFGDKKSATESSGEEKFWRRKVSDEKRWPRFISGLEGVGGRVCCGGLICIGVLTCQSWFFLVFLAPVSSFWGQEIHKVNSRTFHIEKEMNPTFIPVKRFLVMLVAKLNLPWRIIF